MAESRLSLWPEDIAEPDRDAPVAVLRMQASELEKLSGGKLKAEIRSDYYEEKHAFGHGFYVSARYASAADFYVARVLRLRHGESPYPATVTSAFLDSEDEVVARSREELEGVLRRVFTSQGVKDAVRTIATLAG